MSERIPNLGPQNIIDIDQYRNRRPKQKKRTKKEASSELGDPVLPDSPRDVQNRQKMEEILNNFLHAGDQSTFERILRLYAQFTQGQLAGSEALENIQRIAGEAAANEPAEPHETQRKTEPDYSNVHPIGVFRYDSHPAPEIPQDASGRSRVIPFRRP